MELQEVIDVFEEEKEYNWNVFTTAKFFVIGTVFNTGFCPLFGDIDQYDDKVVPVKTGIVETVDGVYHVIFW